MKLNNQEKKYISNYIFLQILVLTLLVIPYYFYTFVANELSRVLAAMLGKYGAAPLIRLYKAKERNGALRGSRAYIHGGTMLNNTVRCLRPASGSPLGLDPSHVPVRSRGSVYP